MSLALVGFRVRNLELVAVKPVICWSPSIIDYFTVCVTTFIHLSRYLRVYIVVAIPLDFDNQISGKFSLTGCLLAIVIEPI